MPGTPIPIQMYVAYLGSLALLDALVVLVFYVQYQRGYEARLRSAQAKARVPVPMPREKPAATPPSPTRSGPTPFWDGSMAMMVITLVGLLIPLLFVLDQQSYVGAANERAFGVATAIMAFAVAGMVHVLERNLFRRRAATGS